MLTDHDTFPTSGIIMCVRCNAPAAECQHSPVRVDRDSTRYALAKLEELARCEAKGIRVYQAGDDDVLCANDLIPLYATRGGYIHDQDYIRRLRNTAMAEAWPR